MKPCRHYEARSAGGGVRAGCRPDLQGNPRGMTLVTLKESEKVRKEKGRNTEQMGQYGHLRRENGVSLVSGHRVYIGNDEKIGGFQWWWWLHNTVNVSRATESDTNGSHDKYYVIYINHNKHTHNHMGNYIKMSVDKQWLPGWIKWKKNPTVCYLQESHCILEKKKKHTAILR